MSKEDILVIYELKPFKALSLEELYGILRLRQEVFIVEQQCPYLDADGKDFEAFHLLGKDTNGEILCYTRILPEGVSYKGYVSIGRVINSSKVRGEGQGKILMANTIEHTKKLFPSMPIKIGAQSYLKRFYESFGFVDIHQPYMEDGIPHIIMVMN